MTQATQTMKAVQLMGHGGLDKLVYKEDVAKPSVQADQVLVKVAAAGVNNTDINTRLAWYSKGESDHEDASWSGEPLSFPFIQGADVCGYIEAVGENVSADRIGERVMIEPCMTQVHGKKVASFWYLGSECDGGFAQYTVVDSVHAFKVNSDMSDVELASFPCSYSTAENLLSRTQVAQSDTVLITGASGGVGSAAIQLAKARGAKVIVVSSPSKQQTLLSLGADVVLNRNMDLLAELGENSVDVVIDLVAGEQWPTLLQLLKPKGRYGVSGAIGGALVELDVRTLYLKDLSFFGCTHLDEGVFARLVSLIEARAIRPVVAKVFDLQDIHQAQITFLEKLHTGKIVLRVP